MAHHVVKKSVGMMGVLVSRSERLERALSSLARRGTVARLHRVLVASVGVGVDGAGYVVLRRVHQEGPARITDLAELLGVEPSTVSRHVQGLERAGWLVRGSDEVDGRVCRVGPTEVGSGLVERVEEERRRVLDRARGDWSDAEVDGLVDSLERFANDLSAVLTKPEDEVAG